MQTDDTQINVLSFFKEIFFDNAREHLADFITDMEVLFVLGGLFVIWSKTHNLGAMLFMIVGVALFVGRQLNYFIDEVRNTEMTMESMAKVLFTIFVHLTSLAVTAWVAWDFAAIQ